MAPAGAVRQAWHAASYELEQLPHHGAAQAGASQESMQRLGQRNVIVMVRDDEASAIVQELKGMVCGGGHDG